MSEDSEGRDLEEGPSEGEGGLSPETLLTVERYITEMITVIFVRYPDTLSDRVKFDLVFGNNLSIGDGLQDIIGLCSSASRPFDTERDFPFIRTLMQDSIDFVFDTLNPHIVAKITPEFIATHTRHLLDYSEPIQIMSAIAGLVEDHFSDFLVEHGRDNHIWRELTKMCFSMQFNVLGQKLMAKDTELAAESGTDRVARHTREDVHDKDVLTQLKRDLVPQVVAILKRKLSSGQMPPLLDTQMLTDSFDVPQGRLNLILIKALFSNRWIKRNVLVVKIAIRGISSFALLNKRDRAYWNSDAGRGGAFERHTMELGGEFEPLLVYLKRFQKARK
jgi:hypothetical protein